MTTNDSIDRPRSDLIAAERVKGTEVYNTAGEKLGTIDTIYIDKQSGTVAYVVMSFGGFLGIGEKYHPLPWDLLDYDTDLDGYRVDLDRSALEGAPSYGREDVDRFDYDRDAADIDSYYAPMTRSARPAGLDVGGTRNADGTRPAGFYSPEQQTARNHSETAATTAVDYGTESGRSPAPGLAGSTGAWNDPQTR